jgi:colanic acid/amylovoran biosynthesis protein
LFLDILLKRYSKHEFYAISQFANNYNYSNLHIFSNKYIYKIIKKFNLSKYIANHFDMVVTIGGSMFMEKETSHSDLTLGKNDRYILGVNFGPYKTQEFFNSATYAFSKCKDVCFREKYSYDLFKDLPNVRYAPDIAFGLDKSKLKITNRKRAIVSVISSKFKLNELNKNLGKSSEKYTNVYEDKMVNLVNRLVEKDGYEVLLLSMCENQGDNEVVKSIYARTSFKVREKIETYNYNGNIDEVLNLFADSSLIIGSRFHANIIGMVLGKPIIPFIYSDKMTHVIDDILENNKNDTPLMVDIRYMDTFDIDSITQEDLTRVVDISDFDGHTEDAFRELDKILL